MRAAEDCAPSTTAISRLSPRVALATLDIPAYAPDALPPELAALPAVKPGSRALAGVG